MADIGNRSPEGAPSSVGEQTRARQEAYIKNAKGDAVGNNWVVPKADFGNFLGYKPPTPTELNGEQAVSGSRVIELALQKQASELGLGSAERGNDYRNINISWGRYNNEPGREHEMIKDGLDAIHASLDHHADQDKNVLEQKAAQMSPSSARYLEEARRMQKDSHNDNVKYLEMQYRFQEMGKQETVISNLMKKRADVITQAVRGGSSG